MEMSSRDGYVSTDMHLCTPYTLLKNVRKINLINKTGLLLLFMLGLIPGISLAQNAADSTSIEIQNPLDIVTSDYTISTIKVVGNSSYDDNFIVASSGLTAGKSIKIPGPAIGNAIKRLYQTGLFSDVEIYQTSQNGGQINLEIKVVEQPRLAHYKIEGVKRSERHDLKDRMPLLVGYALTKSNEAQAENTIKRFFAGKGYWGTKVSVEKQIVDTTQNRADVIFHVKKGKRLEIKRIRFYGNNDFSNKTLRHHLKGVKQDAWWRIFSKATFKRDKYEDAKTKLADFYKNHGYRDFYIKSDSVYTYDIGKGDRGIGIDIHLYEGPQYHIRNITWEGNTVYTDKQLSTALDMKKGDVLDNQKFDQNLHINKNNDDVTSMYNDIGYLFFQIQPDIKVVHKDSLDIDFHITEDKIATFRKVIINGNTRTNENVIRRSLRTYPGDTYSRSNIMRSVRELSTLGYFSPKGINPDLNYDYQNKTADVIYNLKETTGNDNFEFSGGFGGQGIGLILSAKINFNNFSIQNLGKQWPIPTGDGQKLSLGVQVTGGGYQNYSLSFNEPWFRGRPVSLGFNTSYSLYKYNDYYTNTRRRDEVFAVGVSSARQLNWPDDYFSQTTSVQFQKYNVQGSYYNDNGKLSTLTISETIARNSLDNYLNPSRGSKLSLTAELAPPLAGLSQYYKILFKYQHHMPVVGKLTFTNGMELGHMGWFGSKNQSPFERFFLGGTPLQQQQTFTRDNIDLRGYPGGYSGSISPFVNGLPVGGTMYVKYYSEMRYPVVSNESVQLIPYLFAEGGNSYLGFKNFDPFNIKRSTGVGLRIFLPILGMVDLSYGYRFDGIPNTSVNAGQWVFLFNIGSPF